MNDSWGWLVGHNNRFPLLFMKIGIFYFSRSFAKTWIKDQRVGMLTRTGPTKSPQSFLNQKHEFSQPILVFGNKAPFESTCFKHLSNQPEIGT